MAFSLWHLSIFLRMPNGYLLFPWLVCLALHGWRTLGHVAYWHLVARCMLQAFDLSVIGKGIA